MYHRYFGELTLSEAIKAGHISQVNLHLANGLDINKFAPYGRSFLVLASQSGHLEIVRLLLERGALVNQHDAGRLSSLHHAAAHGFVEIASLLLDHRADIDAQDAMGNTALHLSVQFKQPAVEALLITRGANPAIMNKKNLTFDEVDPIRRDAAWRKRYPLILLREKLKQAESAATSSAAL